MAKRSKATAPGQPTLHVDMSAEEEASLKKEWDKFEAERAANKYKRDRLKAYKNVRDQLDMLYHDLKNNTETWLTHIESVKNQYPKPE